MDLRNLLLRASFGLILAALSLIILQMRLPAAIAKLRLRQFDFAFLAFFFLGHILIFITAFFVLHQKTHGDLPAFYLPQAHSVMQGLVPYRDFKSSYAPLNPFLDAALLRIHDSPLSILLFQILCDVASVPFWIGFLRRCLPEPTVRRAALLYMFQPLVIWGTCIDGKNHGCISLLLGVALYAIARREILSGVSYSLTIVLLKILPLMFLPALFLGARKRVTWLVSALILPIVVYGAFALHHIDIALPLRVEGNMITPGNLPFLLVSLCGLEFPPRAIDGLALAITGAAVAFAALMQFRAQVGAQRLWRLALSMLLTLFTVLTFTKKSDASYLTMAFFLVCALTAIETARTRRFTSYVYAILSAIALPITSFWYWPMRNESAVQIHSLLMTGDRNAIVLLIGQGLMVFCYFWFAALMIAGLRDPLPAEVFLGELPAVDPAPAHQ